MKNHHQAKAAEIKRFLPLLLDKQAARATFFIFFRPHATKTQKVGSWC
jgi:hypothetical protein